MPNLNSFEVICKSNGPAKAYFRFDDGTEVRRKVGNFIDREQPVITKKQISDQVKQEFDYHCEQLVKGISDDSEREKALLQTKTTEFLRKIELSVKDRLETADKIKKGRRKFKKFIDRLQKFASEIYAELED